MTHDAPVAGIAHTLNHNAGFAKSLQRGVAFAPGAEIAAYIAILRHLLPDAVTYTT